MFTFNSPVASAHQLFGNGFVIDVYFDLYAGESNILISSRADLAVWIRDQAMVMARDISSLLEVGDTEDALMISQTVTELSENLRVLETLDSSYRYIIFHDGRLFK